MAVALVGSGISAGDVGHVGAGPFTTGTYDTTGATLLVAAHVRNTSAGAWPTLSDSLGNTWTHLTPRVEFPNARLSYVINPTTGSGQTFTSGTLASSASSLAVLAFSGAGAFGSENGGTQGWGTNVSCGSVTPAANGALVVAGLGYGSAGLTGFAISAGLTIQQHVTQSGSDHNGVVIAYLIQTTAAPINPQWSWTGDSGAAAVIATFAAAAGGRRFLLAR